MNSSTVLMGTIIERNGFPHKAIRDIVEALNVSSLFVFKIKNKSTYLITYNLDRKLLGTKLPELSKRHNTIRIHRKKNKNIFFTIKGIEIAEKNKINIEDFNDCLLLSSNGELQQLFFDLVKIIKFKGE